MLNGQTGAFGGRMIQIDIEPFSREETKRYVDERSNNVKFSDKGFNQFYLCTKGIPIYINTLCSILPANSVCDENIILENIKLNIDHIALMWIYVWGRLNANEREIVILLNENNGANWTTLKNSLPYSTPTISKYLDSLSNKGIVDYDFNKKYVISDNMLKTSARDGLELLACHGQFGASSLALGCCRYRFVHRGVCRPDLLG